MDRIDSSTRAVDGIAVGKDGFTGGDPALGIAATVVTAEWLDDVQESIVESIEAARLTPAKGDYDQLVQALRRMHGDIAVANWSALASPGAVALKGIAYGSVRYIAVGEAGAIQVSDDMVAWTTKTAAGAYAKAFQAVSFIVNVSAGEFTVVAVGEGPAIQRSVDNGDTWAAIENGAGATYYYDVAYGRAAFFLCGDGGVVKRSADFGATWTAAALPGAPTTNLRGVAASNTTIIVVGDAGEIYRSADGITWTLATVPAGAPSLESVAYDSYAGVWYAGGATTMWTSADDGLTWTAVSGFDATVSVFALRYDGVHIVAIGARGAASVVLVSRDGVTWKRTDVATGLAGPYTGLARGTDRWVALGGSAGATTIRASLRDWR